MPKYKVGDTLVYREGDFLLWYNVILIDDHYYNCYLIQTSPKLVKYEKTHGVIAQRISDVDRSSRFSLDHSFSLKKEFQDE